VQTSEPATEGTKSFTVTGSGEGLGTEFVRSDRVEVEADCTPPGTTIDSGPPALTNNATPSIAFSGPGATGFECTIDGGPASPCTSPTALPTLPDGNHSFAVAAFDAVGNVDPTPATRAFRVDTALDDPRILVASRLAVRRKARLGEVEVSMGESGTVEIGGVARLGRKRAGLVVASRDLDGDDRVVALRARRGDRRLVRKALGRGRRVEVIVKPRFADEAGNEASRKVSFRARVASGPR
jgi:hypothetical protein